MFVLSFFAVFASWVLAVACAALASGLVGLCLLIPFDLGPWVQLPELPYWCGVLHGLALLAQAAETCAHRGPGGAGGLCRRGDDGLRAHRRRPGVLARLGLVPISTKVFARLL